MKMWLAMCCILLCITPHNLQRLVSETSDETDMGTLAGDVQNGALLIQNYILQMAVDAIKRDYTQGLIDQAKYTFEKRNGEDIVKQVKQQLTQYFAQKKQAAQKIAAKAAELYDEMYRKNEPIAVSTMSELLKVRPDDYRDADIPDQLPREMKFDPYFKQKVSLEQSAVKITDEVPRDHPNTINTVLWTAKLEDTFKENHNRDKKSMRWQYFGSIHGVARFYPGREWDTNFAGFYKDYDPRTRPWYIAATSGPKDVVIVMDCSESMKGEKFGIAKAVAKTVIQTLTRQDYVNVICARASHWNEVGKWHKFDNKVLSCQQNQLVQATNAMRKNLIEEINNLVPGGTSELEKGFEKAFDLLSGTERTGCQAIIVFITDGKDTDGEQVRCGPGYYTRSGYVPGPICKYDWTKVWSEVEAKNSRLEPQKARIFSYLIVDEGEEFPGQLACNHSGSFLKLTTGENLISEMMNYFEFLASSSMAEDGMWTSPYLDAWGLGAMVTYTIPSISKETGQTIGVAGVDATLDEIANMLGRHQWGMVKAFLINRDEEVIYHPDATKTSATLLDDPIPVPITDLEKNENFLNHILPAMRRGQSGQYNVPNGRENPYTKKKISVTYYYAALTEANQVKPKKNETDPDEFDYAFAIALTENDKEFRRLEEPTDKTGYEKSYYNTLIEYNSTKGRNALPGTFEYLQVKYNEPVYPELRVSYLHSSIFLAPKCHCDPNAYMSDDDLGQKTVDAHLWINGVVPDKGCEGNQKFERGVRADVLIPQPVERLWRTRHFPGSDAIRWTYVGMRSGVFRTYPGHRSRRGYDPTGRPWFKRAASTPAKISISTPYMDDAGAGKILTISRAIFEGMMQRNQSQCKIEKEANDNLLPGGCRCEEDKECIIGVCYDSKAPFWPGEEGEYKRCATERVEAVTSTDLLYDSFHNVTMSKMAASDGIKSCGNFYTCPDGEPGCQTRCYLFDNSANLITDPDFLTADFKDTRTYSGVTLGRKEGEVMKDLVYRHNFFTRTQKISFQGTCTVSPRAAKVTLVGIPKNPGEVDDWYKNKGPIPDFSNDFGCITDDVSYSVNDKALGNNGMIVGNVSGPCMSGFYYVTNLPMTNLYLLVIENWKEYKDSFFYNFNCHIARSVVNSGSYKNPKGTCGSTETIGKTLHQKGKCPKLRDIKLPCSFNTGSHHSRVDLTAFTSLLFTLYLVVTSVSTLLF